MNPLDRDAWRALDLEFVVMYCDDAPLLAFEDEQALFAIVLEAEIDELAERRAELRKSQRRAAAQKRVDDFLYFGRVVEVLDNKIRKKHLDRVTLAIGVKLPGHPHVVHEFVAPA